MKSKKYRAIFLIYIIMMVSVCIQAQSRDVLTILHSCIPNCLNLTISGGYANYEVEWQEYNSSTNSYTTVSGWPMSGLNGQDGMEDLCNPTATKYHVIVHDALCGEADLYYDVDLCKCGTKEIIVESISNVSACGNYDPEEGTPAYDNCDGAATVSFQGSTTGDFEWSNGMTGASVSGLCTGSYTVTVTTSSGCTATKEVNICCCNSTSPTSGTYPQCGSSPTITDADMLSPTTSTAADGAIALITSGNAQANNVIYKWEGPGGYKSNSKNISGLKVGTYCVTISDGCSSPVSQCYTLKDCSSTSINLSGSVLNTCGNTKNGKIIAAASGGFSPYKYKWSNGASGATNNLLGAGTYCVTATDKFGCRGTACFSIDGSTNLTTIRCEEFCNGNFVNTYGPEVEVANPQNCFQSMLICAQSQKIVEGPYDNFWYDINTAGCVWNFYNGTTNQLCYTSLGTPCTDCIFGSSQGFVFGCDVSYCYFPELSRSVITGIREYNSVTSISVGDGDCFVQVFDDCSGGIEVANGEVPCNDIPVQDGDCSDLFQIGDIFSGSFGSCGGFGGRELGHVDDVKIPPIVPENIFKLAIHCI